MSDCKHDFSDHVVCDACGFEGTFCSLCGQKEPEVARKRELRAELSLARVRSSIARADAHDLECLLRKATGEVEKLRARVRELEERDAAVSVGYCECVRDADTGAMLYADPSCQIHTRTEGDE